MIRGEPQTIAKPVGQPSPFVWLWNKAKAEWPPQEEK
jgi:hypothetical protein